jgi:hypothetical protein
LQLSVGDVGGHDVAGSAGGNEADEAGHSDGGGDDDDEGHDDEGRGDGACGGGGDVGGGGGCPAQLKTLGSVPTTVEAWRVLRGCSCIPVPSLYLPCTFPVPSLYLPHRRVLRGCSCIVGMHPDGATEAIVDFALARGLPFAVVPCCVFAVDFRARGRGVSSTAAFVRYLAAKAPGRISVATLPFEGRNQVGFPKTRKPLDLPSICPDLLSITISPLYLP